MELFRQYSEWQQYLGIQLAAAEVDERYADAKVDKLHALAQIKNRAEKNVSTMKALATADEEYAEAKAEHSEAYSYRKLVEALYRSVESRYFHVSREITRRSNSAERNGRNERYSD